MLYNVLEPLGLLLDVKSTEPNCFLMFYAVHIFSSAVNV